MIILFFIVLLEWEQEHAYLEISCVLSDVMNNLLLHVEG